MCGDYAGARSAASIRPNSDESLPMSKDIPQGRGCCVPARNITFTPTTRTAECPMRGPFGPIQPTPYDLTFTLFGIPVRVVPWFWVGSVVMGFDVLKSPGHGFVLLLGWVG